MTLHFRDGNIPAPLKQVGLRHLPVSSSHFRDGNIPVPLKPCIPAILPPWPNGYFVGAINRVGTEVPWNIGEFYGSSYFCDPRGRIFSQASRDQDEVSGMGLI